MENEKKKNGLVVGIMVVLILALLGTTSYIVYDKIIKKDEPKTENKKEKESKENNDTEKKETDKTNTGFKEYSVGEEITFSNEKWFVISNSDKNQDYVVVIKSSAVEEFSGRKAYYTCLPEDDNGLNCNHKMYNDYEKSAPKKYFDDTYLDILGRQNLKEVNGYKIRLITLDELVTLGCEVPEKTGGFCSNLPSWFPSTATMTPVADSQDSIWSYRAIPNDHKYSRIDNFGVGSTLPVCPVINLLKINIQ